MSGQSHVETAWQAIRRHPARLAATSWPWRSVSYLLAGIPLCAAWLGAVAVLLVIGLATTPIGVGLIALAAVPMSAVFLGRAERRLLRLVDRRPTRDPHLPAAGRRARALLATRLYETATWLELVYGVVLTLFSVLALTLVLFLLLPALALLGAPVLAAFVQHRRINVVWSDLTGSIPGQLTALAAGCVLAVIAAYVVTLVAAARGTLARKLLADPKELELRERLSAVTESRTRLASDFDSQRRQLERDLHDGAQQRLTLLIAKLGLARLELADEHSPARELVDQAYEHAQITLNEIRVLAQGLQPAILTERGLAGALERAAELSILPVLLTHDLPGRYPDEVEATAYFLASEALTNASRHGGATSCRLAAWSDGDRIRITVEDNGRGGADASRGTGLRGLMDRVAAAGGTMTISSPPGGPTLLEAELPCGS